MRDLEAIHLNVDACLLRARIRAEWALELQLRQFLEDLHSASSTSAIENEPARSTRQAQLVEMLITAAESAGVAGDATLEADIHRAARDLRVWYHLDDLRGPAGGSRPEHGTEE